MILTHSLPRTEREAADFGKTIFVGLGNPVDVRTDATGTVVLATVRRDGDTWRADRIDAVSGEWAFHAFGSRISCHEAIDQLLVIRRLEAADARERAAAALAAREATMLANRTRKVFSAALAVDTGEEPF